MFTIAEILSITKGTLINGSQDRRVSGVAINTRTIRPNQLFVAIRGSRFDGHSFILQAARLGAAAILFKQAYSRISSLANKGLGSSIPLISVKSTVQALGALAHYYRRRFNIPVIAITGSNGKTTTKEIISHILSRRFNVLRNPGTENNAIGVSLAILRLRPRHNLAVLEIGANHPGEIDRLSWMIRPTVGVITNIGPSHLQFFKNLKGVFKAKLELMQNLAKNAKLIINQDDRFLSQLHNHDFKTVTFGLNQRCDFQAETIQLAQEGTAFLLNKRQRIFLPVLGRHNVYNALAAIAVARGFGMSYNEIKGSLASFQAPAMRMQVLNIRNIKVISDCYNANPGSLACALDFLCEYANCGRKVAVCGDMLELGKDGPGLHRNMGKKIGQSKMDFLITVGPLSRNIASGASQAGMPRNLIHRCASTSEAAEALRSVVKAGDCVLVKGSRGMEMENVLKCFTISSIR